MENWIAVSRGGDYNCGIIIFYNKKLSNMNLLCFIKLCFRLELNLCSDCVNSRPGDVVSSCLVVRPFMSKRSPSM